MIANRLNDLASDRLSRPVVLDRPPVVAPRRQKQSDPGVPLTIGRSGLHIRTRFGADPWMSLERPRPRLARHDSQIQSDFTVAAVLETDFWKPISAQYDSCGIAYDWPDPLSPRARNAGAICSRIINANAS